MTATARKRARGAELRKRIGARAASFASCVVLDCNQPTTARAGRGLNRHYCQRHVEHYRRHGSYSKGSYRAKDLNPRRQAALEWLRTHRELPEVGHAIAGILALYERSGRPEETFRLAGKSPEERAWNVWARCRRNSIDPMRVLEVWIAVELCHCADQRPERKAAYRWVQSAKLIHRMAGGSHKSWTRETADGSKAAIELHKYSTSRGRVLWRIGEMVNDAAQVLRELVTAIAKDS